jgi:hypothetical protein
MLPCHASRAPSQLYEQVPKSLEDVPGPLEGKNDG